MWLFTKYGFYSIVQDRADARNLVVRARDERDIKKFVREARKIDGKAGSHKHTPRNDYPWRMVCRRSVVLAVVEEMVRGIVYGNFKSQIQAQRDPSRDRAYHHVWADMVRWQQEGEAAAGNPTEEVRGSIILDD